MCKFYQPAGRWALLTITLGGDNVLGLDDGVPVTKLEIYP